MKKWIGVMVLVVALVMASFVVTGDTEAASGWCNQLCGSYWD